MTDAAPDETGAGARPTLSIAVACFNMRREIARTLYALSGAYQAGIDPGSYEVVLIDNGSDDPPRVEDFAGLDLRLTVLRQPNPTKSPVAAMNAALAACTGDYVVAMIDGARMPTPGLLDAWMKAARLHPRPILFTQSLSLGHGAQWLIAREGYDQAQEDRLLDSIGWPKDGYRLFEISTWETFGPTDELWATRLYETNALCMPRALWEEVGGYDPRFQTPGGGWSNHDVLARACALPDVQLIVITGEGTFHQLHSHSVSSRAKDPVTQLKVFSREFHQIRGRPVRPLAKRFWTFGIKQPPPPRISGPTTAAPTRYGPPERRYVELLKQALLNEHALELEARDLIHHEQRTAGQTAAEPDPKKLARARRRVADARRVGVHLATLPATYTMIGRRRLDALERHVNQVLDEGVPGDLMECGVWRGGACILMNGIVRARRAPDRAVWVADSFNGLPPPADTDEGWDFTAEKHPALAVDLETVKSNFERFDLLDERVRFLEGWFKDTLPVAPIERLAVLRLDGDLYSSTMDALTCLYDKVSSGGFVTIDDYGGIAQCARAVSDFRASRGITEPIQKIDWTGVFWRKA